MSLHLDWNGLKRNRCPGCRKDLSTNIERIPTSNGPGLRHKCGFTISDARFSAIVAGQISKDLMYQDTQVLEESFL